MYCKPFYCLSVDYQKSFCNLLCELTEYGEDDIVTVCVHNTQCVWDPGRDCLLERDGFKTFSTSFSVWFMKPKHFDDSDTCPHGRVRIFRILFRKSPGNKHFYLFIKETNCCQKFHHRNFSPTRTAINNQMRQWPLSSLYTIIEVCGNYMFAESK